MAKTTTTETEIDAAQAAENARSQAAHERGIVDAKIISATRPAAAEYELDASEVLLKRDGKDIYKKSTARKSRYAMVFPGHLNVIKEGKMGEMREMHTQSPVVYLDFPNGRIKLLGTIVRPKSTRYFTLNAKSRDRMNLEEWFDNVIIFPTWYWIGSSAENPEEKPLAMPTELSDLSDAAEVDWESSVAAGGAKASDASAAVEKKKKDAAVAAAEESEKAEKTGRRPRRQAATAARKKMYADDSDVDGSESDDDDDERITSPVVVRGKVESFMPNPPPTQPKPAPPVRQSVSAPQRASVSAPKPKSAPPPKRQKKEEAIVIDDSDDEEEDESDDDDDDVMELDDDDSDDESEEEEDDDDSDFE